MIDCSSGSLRYVSYIALITEILFQRTLGMQAPSQIKMYLDSLAYS